MQPSDRLKLFKSIDEDLAEDMNLVASFLLETTSERYRPKPRGKTPKAFDSQDYWEWWGAKFAKPNEIKLNLPERGGVDPALVKIFGEMVKRAEPSKTMPSHEYSTENATDNFENLLREDLWVHQLAMTSENKVGELLEAYLASVLGKHGWVWCRNATAKAIDFVKENKDGYFALQIKNADNTENSSSSDVRAGTDIQEWHRLAKKKTVDEWEKFPDKSVRHLLSEEGFLAYVSAYLHSKT